jgi:hypothetical protein
MTISGIALGDVVELKLIDNVLGTLERSLLDTLIA